VIVSLLLVIEMPLYFRRPSPCVAQRLINENRTIILTDALLKTVTSHRQKGRSKEAGGVLLGRLWKKQITVEYASEPGPTDRAGRCSFERDAQRAQKIINTSWLNSEGEINYLGEWHTHPEPHPHPSPRDRAMIREMFEGAHIHHGSLLLLIIGTKSLWLGIETQEGLEELIFQGNPAITRELNSFCR
jgi:integrative and conjugative element protein (TIGR02256 family)